MKTPQCCFESCHVLKGVLPKLEKLIPASRRAHEKTKYDFHAGYNKACHDIKKQIDTFLSLDTKK